MRGIGSIQGRRAGFARRVAVACALLVLAGLLPGIAATEPAESFARGGLRGSKATMTPVRVAARVSRMAVVPGTKQYWAIGLASAALPGWDVASAGGQVVFLRGNGSGWEVVGPPTKAGRPMNPTLTNFAIAPNGEGWAVGEEGTLVHHVANGGWAIDAQSGITSATLQAVSLGVAGGSLYGYAVGEDRTILRLQGRTWSVESGISAIEGDLIGVSVVSPDEAWAISRSASDALLIWHREGGIWSRFLTQRPMFDNPPSSAGCCATNKAARGSAIAATRNGVWITGEIIPVDPSSPFVDEVVGDQTRPFALFIGNGGGLTSYCPDMYSLGRYDAGPQRVTASRICDRSMPLSAFDLTSLTAFPSGEVLAGGLGLFHFKDGGWFREPNVAGYLVSVAFASPTDGWVASSGNTFGAGGAVYSSTSVLGRWSPAKPTSRVARHPQPSTKVLEAVAIEPGGRRFLAVGQEGISLLRGNDGAWDTIQMRSSEPFHGVAWAGDEAWAVGSRGSLARFASGRWTVTHDPGELVGEALFDVAFRSATDGVAVGEGGVLLRFDGSRWRIDAASRRVTKEALYAITVAGDRYVAVGGAGTVLVSSGSGWRRVQGLTPMLRRGTQDPADLYDVASLGDGRVVIGGGRSSLLTGAPESLAPLAAPPEGTIIALDARNTAAGLRVLASVSEESEKFAGSRLSVSSATLMSYDGAQWRDVHLTAPRSQYPTYEPSAPEDPPLSVAMDPSGLSGWAVGGRVANAIDPDGHIQAIATSALFRYDSVRSPVQPLTESLPDLPKGGTTFAFFGESGCDAALCSLAVGSGVKSDVISAQIQDEINALAGRAGGPEFALYGGSMRRLGLPEELAQYKGFLDRMKLPTFSAVGEQDLFQAQETPQMSGQAGRMVRGALPANNIYYREGFAAAYAPWGTRKAPASIKPVTVVGEPAAATGQARTHYAFDYLKGGKESLRVVVLDSSRRSLSSEGQNPAQTQTDFLNRVLGTRPNGEPAIVVMNQPTLNTIRGFEFPNWTSTLDATTFHSALVTHGVSAAFASGLRVNLVYRVGASGTQVTVPFYVSGAAGAALEETKAPADGFYHGWYLVNVASENTGGALGRAAVTVKSIPSLDSIALHAEEGRNTVSGNMLAFTAIARTAFGGTTDMQQAKALYMQFPRLVECPGPGLADGSCASRQALHPDYEFSTADPSIARFVKPAPGEPGKPLKNAAGELIPDSQSGFLCTFKPGTTTVRIRSGFVQATMPITVTHGIGPCIDEPTPPPPVDPVVPPVYVTPEEARSFGFFRPLAQSQPAALLPPPPAPVVAPAPPGSPGVGTKDEHEVQTETEGHGDSSHQFTAIRRRRAVDPAEQSWPFLGAVALMSLMSAAFAATLRARRIDAERVSQHR